MPTYTPAQVAQQVINQGGSVAQAWVAAALVDGIESSGSTTAANPSSTACGLFQFLTTTWLSNGGGKYAPTACGASLQDQVTVFLTATAGNNFYPWAPDLGGSYDGNNKQAAATAPQKGSPVANKIASLEAGGTLAFLKGIPKNWAAIPPGADPAPASTAATGGGNTGLSQCYVGISIPSAGSAIVSALTLGLAGGSGTSEVCFFTRGNAKWWSGALCIVGGIGLAGFGVVLIASAVGKSTGATAAVKKAAATVGISGSVLAGQPEAAAGIAAKSRSSSRSAPAAPKIPTAGRRESRQIDRNYRETIRQQGPIGPRGANPTANRIANRERRGTSVPGARRPVRRGEGFGGRRGAPDGPQ